MSTKHLLAVLAVSLLGLLVSCGHEGPTGTLLIMSDPPGAAVVIDGIASGDVTPVEILRPVGRVTVSATMDGFLTVPESRSLTISAGRRVDALFDLARLGSLTVTSTPSGGAIHIDGEDSGELTPHTFTIIEGTYTVEVVLDDHLIDGGPRDIDVSADDPATEAFDLLPAGTLAVTSTHTGAAIFIDSVDTGEITPHTFALTAGDYRVHVTKFNFSVEPDFLDVTVAVGAETVADFVTTNVSEYGGLMVGSTPPGATILLDGTDTGEITPHEFSLPGGQYDVQVTRHGFHDPDPRQIAVTAGGDSETDFTLIATKIVLLEYMSGVHCAGCPAMNTMLGNVEAAGFGPDKMLGLKYSGPFGGGDQHYDQNPTVLQDRMTVYANNTAWNWAAPTLFFDGDLPVEPNGYPAIGDLVTLLDAAHAVDPGFAIDVRVDDFAATDITVHVDLVATRDITNANAVLNVAIVENPIYYDTPQNDAGEDEFHWICREFVLGDASPLPIGPDTPASFDINVVRQGTWVGVPENLIAIAFVQDDQTLVVLQAGATDSGHTGGLN
jgi:hypothetical protein